MSRVKEFISKMKKRKAAGLLLEMVKSAGEGVNMVKDLS